MRYSAGAPTAAGLGSSPPQPVDQEIDHGRRVQRQYLRDEQAADDGDAERPAQFGAGTGGQDQRDACE